MKRLLMVFLLMLFFHSAFAQLGLDIKSTIKERVDATVLFKYDDFNGSRSVFIPKLFYLSVFSNLVDTNRYIVMNVYNQGFITLSFPVIVPFSNFIETFQDKEILSENSALVSYSNEQIYIKREGNYITLVDGKYMANYNALGLLSTSSGYSKKFDLFLSKLSKSNASGFFSYLQQFGLKDFKTGLKLVDDNYNIVNELDYIEGFIYDNRILGKIYLNSTLKSSKLYVSRASRSLSLNIISDIRNLITVSVNPLVFSDLVELFYPDIVSAFPSIKKEIVNTFSGTVGILYYGGGFTNRVDVIVLLGTKSESQSKKFLSNFLGLFKYKILNVKGNRVYELSFQNETVYLFMSAKEFVVATQMSSMERYLDDLKKKVNNNYSFAYPTVYANVYLDIFRETLSRILGLDLSNLSLVGFYADIDDTLRSINYSLWFE